VYPLTEDEVYELSSDSTGKVANVGNFTPSGSGDEWTIPLLNSSFLFDEESPTKRLYIGNNQISYCLLFGGVYRYDNSLGGSQVVPPPSSNVLMAEYINFSDSSPAFVYTPATLKRNALVQVRLHFANNEESYVYENEIHIENVP
jgi:MSHA biogenesis protein MshO